LPSLPNLSATTVVNGYTVDDPTILIGCELASETEMVANNINTASVNCLICISFG
jgi:hypothetical protein